MKIFKNWLITWLFLQLAIGPVFFFVVNLALQKSLSDGFAGVCAVTLVDFLYIILSILGIGKLLEKKKLKKIFGIISSAILILLGSMILKSIIIGQTFLPENTSTTNLVASFTTVFLLTIVNPMTIVWYTSLFTAKAIEYNYTKKKLWIFWTGVGFATFVFLSIAVFLFFLIKETIPLRAIQLLNATVGCLLIGYGSGRLWKTRKNKT